MAEEQKLISVPKGYGGGSDAWFWDEAAGPDDDLRPFWETMDFLPQPPAPDADPPPPAAKARRITVTVKR